MRFGLRKPVKRSTSRFGTYRDDMLRRGVHLRCLRCEQLEDRRLLSGVTLITHGFGGSVDGWVTEMANAIFWRPDLTIDQPRYTISVTDPGHDNGPLSVAQTNFTGPSPTSLLTDDPEIVILLDWSDLAGSFAGGHYRSTVDVAAAVVEALVAPSFLGGLPGAVAELPFHLIGHSRGGSLVSAIARELGERGVWVDQVTTLDPKPLDGIGEPQNFHDGPMRLYDNIGFADNYWRKDGFTLDFDGEEVSGAFNLQFDDGDLAGGYQFEHQDTHLWYHGTIDTTGPIDDGTKSVPANAGWYDGDMGPRDQIGYYYSRIVGGQRPTAGIAGNVGGNGTRVPISNHTNDVWPSLVELVSSQMPSVLAG